MLEVLLGILLYEDDFIKKLAHNKLMFVVACTVYVIHLLASLGLLILFVGFFKLLLNNVNFMTVFWSLLLLLLTIYFVVKLYHYTIILFFE